MQHARFASGLRGLAELMARRVGEQGVVVKLNAFAGELLVSGNCAASHSWAAVLGNRSRPRTMSVVPSRKSSSTDASW